ncbi:MAG: trigger factor [Saprospiraceae bacterium]
MPNIQRKDIDNTSCLVTVTVTKAEIQPKINTELKRVKNKAVIKGFRQGHAPDSFIKRMYGPSIFGEVLGELLSERLSTYLEENKIDILGRPMPTENQQQYSFKVDQLEDEYAVEYEVGFVPSFEIQGLNKAQTFERLTISNLTELAENDLEYTRKRAGKRTEPETDIIETDLVKIAARELDGDQPKTDGWETTVSFLVNSVHDETLKNEVLTKKKGDTLRFNARSLEIGHDESRYRKFILNLPVIDDRVVGDWFEGTIETVSRIEPANLDEEFFTGHFGEGVTTLEAALEVLKPRIRGFYDLRINALLMRAFQIRLLEHNRFDLPDTFLKRWLLHNNEELNQEQVEREYPAFAENLRWSLLRDRMKSQFDAYATEDDLRAEYANRVRNYFQAEIPDHIIMSSVERLMQDEKDVSETKQRIETDKLFEAIRYQVTLTDKAVHSDELHNILDAITQRAKEEQAADATLRQTME